jgi:hypothetical protein
MEKTNLIEDDLWDHYSGLPSPLWYQQLNEDEENNTDNMADLESLAAEDQENKKKQVGSVKDKPIKE